MRRLVRSLLILVFGAVTLALSDLPISGSDYLHDLWVVDAIAGAPPEPGEPLMVNFGAGTFAVTGGCNRMGFTYRTTGHRFAYPPKRGAMTVMLCPAAQMGREIRFAKLFTTARSFAYRGDQHLVITTGAGDILLHRGAQERRPSECHRPASATRWKCSYAKPAAPPRS